MSTLLLPVYSQTNLVSRIGVRREIRFPCLSRSRTHPGHTRACDSKHDSYPGEGRDVSHHHHLIVGSSGER